MYLCFFFSKFINACGREISNSIFLYLLLFVFSVPNSPKHLIWTHKTEFRLSRFNVIFTVKFSEYKKVNILLFQSIFKSVYLEDSKMITVKMNWITYLSTKIKCSENIEGINKIQSFIANLPCKSRKASIQNLYKDEWKVPPFCLMNILSRVSNNI
jgi:hypothetical protein